MKLIALSLILVLETVSGQFGDMFGNRNGGGQCDYRALMQAVQQKERCFNDFLDMKKEAMQAIMRSDPTCNKGLMEGWEKCDPIFEPWLEQNDLSTQGVMECCFGNRVGGSQRRQCEFAQKPSPHEGGKKKGKKGKGGHSGGGSGERGGRRGGPRGMMDPMEREREQRHNAKKTLAGLGLMAFEETTEMIDHLFWCFEEERPIELSAAQGPYRMYKDKLIAKAFECYGPLMTVATNCTDVQSEDIECIKKGMSWNELFKMDCILSCHPDSLNSFCNMFTQGQQSMNVAMNNGMNSNSRMNGNTMNRNTNRNNFRSNNQPTNDFFDPFGY